MKLTKKVVCSVVAVIGLVTGGVSVGTSIAPIGEVVIDGQSIAELRISQVGLEIIGNAEGCRQSPYTCPSGLATNGIGNTHGVKKKVISLEQVAMDWVQNIQESERCITDAEIVAGKTMTQGEFDAFTSFSFNTGCRRFMKNPDGSSTRIYRYITSGDFIKACKELPKWVYGAGVKLPGLINRRGLEYERCVFSNKHEMG